MLFSPASFSLTFLGKEGKLSCVQWYCIYAKCIHHPFCQYTAKDDHSAKRKTWWVMSTSNQDIPSVTKEAYSSIENPRASMRRLELLNCTLRWEPKSPESQFAIWQIKPKYLVFFARNNGCERIKQWPIDWPKSEFSRTLSSWQGIKKLISGWWVCAPCWTAITEHNPSCVD